METVSGQVENLGTKVECLEFAAAGSDYDDAESNQDIDQEELANLQNDTSPEIVNMAVGEEQSLPARRTRRSAAAILGNHGGSKKAKQ